MTKLKNSNFDETQKLKLGQNSKKQIVTKKKKKSQILTQLKKLKLWQSSKTQIVMVVIVTVMTVVVRARFFNKNNQLHTSTSVWCVQGSFSRSRDVSFIKYTYICLIRVNEQNFTVCFFLFFSQFVSLSFVPIWVSEFCQNLGFLVLSQFYFFLVLSQLEFFSFVTMSFWVLSQIEIFSFVKIWVFEL